MGLSRNDGKNTRRRVGKGYPFIIGRDGDRVVTDRDSATMLGRITPFGNRWDFNSPLGLPVSSPYGYETITDAALALHRSWKKSQIDTPKGA